MDALLGFASIIGFIVCIVMIIVSAIKKTGKVKKWAIGTAVCFAVFIGAIAMGEPNTSTPTTSTVVKPQQQEDIKLSDANKTLLKGSYANFDGTQRTQFEGIIKTYSKLSDTDKSEVKVDFERLSSEKEVVVAKALEESLKKAAEEEAARKAAEVAALKAESKTISYKDLARNPENYKEAKVKYTGEVIQVQESGNDVGLRVNVTKGDYGIYTDTIYVVYHKKIVSGRVLEDDIISIYGTSEGLLTYKTVMGAEMTIPQVLATIVEIHQ